MMTAAARPATCILRPSAYQPWWAQRQLHRSRALIRVIVAGRQSGKTHAAAEEVVRLMLKRPGSQSCLLMPTYKSTKGPERHLRRALRGILGSEGAKSWTWRAVDKLFRLANGAELYIRTADDREGVPTRGLTIDGVLWVDEAAYVPRDAFDAARFTQAAVADPRVIITTTPSGRNWVYEEFERGIDGPKRSQASESFRFRSLDSPYCNAQFVEELKQRVGTRRALQELNAEFLGDANAAFDPDDIAAIFVPTIKLRGTQNSIGLDLGKEQSYTCATLMNEFGEAWVLDRFRHVKWPDQEARAVQLAEEHRALVVVDEGHGGGYGGTMADYLEAKLGKARVLRVKTGNIGMKAQLVETAMSDVENRRVRVQADELGMRLRHELTFFEAHRQVVAGVERWRYHGPQAKAEGDDPDAEEEDDDVRDDCVISFVLANHGRVHGWEPDPGDGGLATFKPKAPTRGPRPGGVGRRGYIFR